MAELWVPFRYGGRGSPSSPRLSSDPEDVTLMQRTCTQRTWRFGCLAELPYVDIGREPDRRAGADERRGSRSSASVGALSGVFVSEMLPGRFISAGANQEAAITLFTVFQSPAVFAALVLGLLAFFVGTALAVVALASPAGPFRWPALALGLGATLIMGEIILAQVRLS